MHLLLLCMPPMQWMMQQHLVLTPRLSVMMSVSKHHRVWQSVDSCNVPRIMDRYFGVRANTSQACELYLIEGVPSASLLYTKKDADNSPIVDEFHLNMGMLLLFDAGEDMRSKLFARHKHPDIHRALNREQFLEAP